MAFDPANKMRGSKPLLIIRKTTVRGLLLAGGCVFAVLFILACVEGRLPAQSRASIDDCFFVPYLMISLALHMAGAPESLVGTGGHIAWLTIPGVVVLLGMPALILLIIALLMGRARRG
jgi:hypothetical protein